MLRVLVSGFRPWTGVTYNPSGVVATRLDGRSLAASEGHPHTATVYGIVLDVAWAPGSAGGAAVQSAARQLSTEAASYRPHLIVSFGVLPNEAHTFDVEPQATDRSIGADVLGRDPSARRSYPSQPETLTLTFDARAILDALNRRLVRPYRAVSDPGLGYYLCERVAYEGARAQRDSAATGATAPGHVWASGFIHVPNPLFGVTGDPATAISTLTAAQQTDLATREGVIVTAAELAVRTALGHIPSAAR